MEKQREKKPGGITGKGFVKGDPRINRTKPGPGRPPLWWKHQLARYETVAIARIGHLARRASGMVGLRAAQDILDRLHGKATQPIEVAPPVDVSGLTDQELQTLDRLLTKIVVVPCNGNSNSGRTH